MRSLDLVAAAICWRAGPRVRQLQRNLAVVVPAEHLPGTTRAAVASYLRYWIEMARLPSDFVARTRVEGEELLTRSRASGRGVVVVAAHQANWDWAGAWLAARHGPVTAVAERVRPEWLFRWFVRRRAERGITVLHHRDDPMPRLQEVLSAGGIVALIVDRALGRSRLSVEFLGGRIAMSPGAAALASTTGAAMIAATMHYDDDALVVRLAQAPEGTPVHRMQWVADRFAESIRAHPQDWHMLQPVFETA